jgi:fructosamine-3-kinase
MTNGIYQKLRKEGDYVPRFLIKLWQIRIKEKFGLEVDSDIAEIIVKIVHERSTWKTSRAEKYITALLRMKGESKEQAEKEARDLVRTVLD